MAQVNTARGPIDTSELGFTLMHEHVFVLTDGLNETFPAVWDEEKRVGEAVKQLNEAYDAGVRTIVDLTVMGLGRNVSRIKRIAEQTRLQIIVATGLYTYNELPRHFVNNPAIPKEWQRGPDYMANFFVRDIDEGIGDTGIKAGILKVATDEQGVTEGVDTVLRAVARAHRRTGAPISTHTHPATKRGLEQQDVFEQEGVDLSRVVIGHSGDTDNIEYLTKIIDRGSYIGMDRFGIEAEGFISLESRVNTIAKLCEAGRADRMVLAHDTSVYMDWFNEDALKAILPRWNYTHISKDVLPMLRERGVGDQQIDQMTVQNPRAIFERQGGY
jgi:phosphotriesterase-related protein